MGQFTALYYICEMAGFLMIGGGIWLLYKQKIYLNAETKEVVAVDLPWLGKIKTNAPALGLFVIGFIPLIYPIYRSGPPGPEYLSLRQHSVKSSSYPVDVYVVIRADVLNKSNSSLNLTVPAIPSPPYDLKLIYLVNQKIYQEESVDPKQAKSGELQIENLEIFPPDQDQASLKPDVQPRPDAFRP